MPLTNKIIVIHDNYFQNIHFFKILVKMIIKKREDSSKIFKQNTRVVTIQYNYYIIEIGTK